MCIKLIKFTLCLVLSSISFKVAAQNLSADGMLNYVTNAFISGAGVYAAPIKAAAERLFWLLLGIAVVSNGIRMATKQEEISSFFAIFVRLTLLTGMFYYLLSHGSEIGASIVDSLASITDTRNVGPSEMLDITFNTGRALNKAVSNGVSGIAASLTVHAMILIFNIVMFLVTIRYITLYLTAYIFCICGVFVLGFGAFSYTRELAVNFLRTVFALALELMTMILVCNAGFGVLDNLTYAVEQLDHVITLQDTGIVLFTALFIHALSVGLPSIVGSLLSSHPGAGSLSFSIPGIPNLFRRIR